MKGSTIFEILAIAQLVFWCDCSAKECTNTPTQFSSHTYRSALLASNDRTRKDEVFLQNHLIHTDDATWSQLLPRKILGETANEDSLDWAMTYRKMKMRAPGSSNSFRSGQNFLKEVSLHDVRLDPDSVHGRAQQANLEYLLSLEVDSLAWSFRETAGMDSPGVAHGGWEKPDCELRGHFVGHYLSASAKAWASTHNDTLKEKMSALVDALSSCQDKIGTGYLSAFPSKFFDRFEAIKPVWAPYYTIHKILAGLLDQYSFAENSKALNMVKWMVKYFYNRVQNVITKYTLERHYESLNEETGGMNDVLYKLYNITGDKKHLVLAHLFDKPCFLGPLAVKADELSGFHANTHIPIVIGSQTRYEVTGDSLHKDIATYFMDVVNSSHSYATGGTSVSEFWSDPKRLASTLQTENEESCTTYNMLKVSRHLFMWTKEIAYADYYERALTNGILGIQRGTEPGVMIYMLPMGRGVSKARSYHGWGTRTNSFWCCYGTGIESFAKLGDSIYFEEEGNQPGLYVIQYISSSLDWKSAQLVINQRVDPVVSSVSYLQATFTFSSLEGTAGKSGNLKLRIPNWSSTNNASALLNGQPLDLKLPGNFHSVYVSKGDTLALQFPITLRIEPIKDDRAEYASLQAILYGPYLLAGLSFGDWDIETSSASSLSDWIIPIPTEYNNDLISLSQANGDSMFSFTNSNGTITIEKRPEAGTDGALQATFRLIPADSTTASKKKFSSAAIDVIGRKVQLEPFDFPGKFVVEQGANENVIVGDSTGSSVFQAIHGLDGQDNTVSLESMSHEGCFLYSNMSSAPGANVQLGCNSESSYARSHALPQLRSSNFKQAASFVLEQGISHYHPISFVAKGATRSFLLLPLLSVRDESYTVYFNIQA